MGECIRNFSGVPCATVKMAIWSSLRPPTLAPVVYSVLRRHPTNISSSVDVVRQAGRISTFSYARGQHGWQSCCCKELVRNGRGLVSPGSLWKFDSGEREWSSGLTSDRNARTFAGLPLSATRFDNPENSDSSEDEAEGKDPNLQKIFDTGRLVEAAEKLEKESIKPELCTADELHYVAVPGTQWRLALWRYRPASNTPRRNHPLLLLSGIGTNALGFDLDPSVSMARAMAGAGFDTWILEVRGAGLSKSEEQLAKEQKPAETSSGTFVENTTESDIDETNAQDEQPRELSSKAGTAGNSDSLAKRSAEPTPMKLESSANDPVKLTNDEDTKGEGNSQSQRSGETGIEQENPNVNGSFSDNALAVTNKEDKLQKDAGQDVSFWDTWKSATSLSNAVLKLSNQLSRLLSEGQSRVLSSRFIDSFGNLTGTSGLTKQVGDLRDRLSSLLEAGETSSAIVTQIADLRKRFSQLLEDGQGAVTPQVASLQDRLNTTVDEFQKVVDLIAKYNWDFDDYLEEDVPTAIEFIRNECKPVDGKLLAVGHSMGGIVLYALLSTRGESSGLVGAVTLASALDYECSNTSLKRLLPLTDPAQLLNVPLVPLGGLMNAVHPLITRPPYALAWLGYNVSAPNMMEPELFSKLIQNNFGIVPVKLLLHLITVFRPGGLANRDGTFKYKENIGKVTVPVFAIAGDRDLICPPEAVTDTVQLFPKETVTYRCFGGENGRHYSHYDIVCSPAAAEEVYPAVLDFLTKHDDLKVGDEAKVEVGV